MTDRVQNAKPARTPEATAWIDEETAAQQARYEAIVKEMDELIPQREQWYAEFLHIVQTRGFNVTGDQRRPIPKEEVPTKPDRDDAMRVVW